MFFPSMSICPHTNAHLNDCQFLVWGRVNTAVICVYHSEDNYFKFALFKLFYWRPVNPAACALPFSSIVVYGSVDTAAQCVLTLGPDPEGCPVLCLKHSSQHLFGALQSGMVVVYARSSTGKVLLSFFSLETAVFQLLSVFRLKSPNPS